MRNIRWSSKLTGGRPMKRGEWRFESWLGNQVYYFTDHFGRVWLADNAWSWIRVDPKGCADNPGWPKADPNVEMEKQ